MKSQMLLGTGVLALLVFACQPRTAATSFTEEDAATLRSMFEKTVKDFSARDFNAWSQQFSDDAILQPPNAPTVRGRAGMLTWSENFPVIDSLRFGNVQVAGDGNLAWGTSDYMLAVKGAPVDTGKQLVVFRRNGSNWETVAVSFSSDLPLPGQAPPATTTTR